MRVRKQKPPNAQKHGIFSASPLIPGENAKEFQNLLNDLVEEWTPDGTIEAELVLSIAMAIWRKRRARRFQEFRLLRKNFDPADPAYDENAALMFLKIALLTDPENAFEKCRSSLRDEKVEYFRRAHSRSSFETTAKWAKAICDEIDATKPKASTAEHHELLNTSELMTSALALTPELFQQEIELDERLDAMRDRGVKRLIELKAMKQMLNRGSEVQTPRESKRISRRT
jgi:hypothetical protein